MIWRVVYGIGASFCAILQYAFVVRHPGKMLQHPMDMVGQNLAMAMTAYCIWQFAHNGKAITKLLAKRRTSRRDD